MTLPDRHHVGFPISFNSVTDTLPVASRFKSVYVAGYMHDWIAQSAADAATWIIIGVYRSSPFRYKMTRPSLYRLHTAHAVPAGLSPAPVTPNFRRRKRCRADKANTRRLSVGAVLDVHACEDGPRTHNHFLIVHSVAGRRTTMSTSRTDHHTGYMGDDYDSSFDSPRPTPHPAPTPFPASCNGIS
jgi:hypothetical protein